MAKLKNQQSADRKEFGLSSLSINQSTSVMVMVILVAILGLTSYLRIPKESSPDVKIPNVFVVTVYPGVAPEDMESLVTQKLEEKINEIADIKKMMSTTTEGYSSINVEFQTGVDMSDALTKVREKVDLARPNLPPAAEEPIVQEINISEFPIMQVNISGQYSLDRLKKVAEDLQEQIESIQSVLEVDLAGGLDREVKVDVDLNKLKYYGVSFTDVTDAIRNENVTVPGGGIDVGNKKFLVRVPGEYTDPKLIEDIVIKAPNDKPIYIKDLAKVDYGYKDRETFARLDGSPVITLSVKKRVGQNIIETSAAVKAVIERNQALFPATTTVSITNDQSIEIAEMVSSLENNILSGLILVIMVLLFFLGVRNSSFVGIAIPMSMFLSFIILLALGITMNMIVLFSLILALGMLVDNAIVVVENIYRYIEEGYDNFEAAKKGTGEVAVPIISGTLTTLAAFFPLLFWPGIVGEFMSYLPITLIITLSSSLFVGLVINPVLCALFMTRDGADNGKPKMSKRGRLTVLGVSTLFLAMFLMSNPVSWGLAIFVAGLLYVLHVTIFGKIAIWWQNSGLIVINGWYSSTLKWSLDNRLKVVGVSFLILISSFAVFGAFNNGIEFFPENIPPNTLYAQIEAPVGTSADFTDTIVRQIEAKVQEMPQIGDAKSIVATAGSQIANGFGGGGSSTHLGTVVVNFKEFNEREFDSFDALEWMQNNLSTDLVGAEITVEQQQNGPPTGKVVNLEINGKDLAQITRLSSEALRILENHPVYAKLEGLETDLPDSRPELRVDVNRELAAKYGLNTNKVGMTVRSAINGVEASKFRDGKEEYDITVRLAEQYRNDLAQIGDLTVMAENDRQVPISALANWNIDKSPGGVNRINMERVITVSADVKPEFQANVVLDEVKEVLSPFIEQLPQGVAANWTGQQQEQDDAQEFLTLAFLIALFLITFILVSQFNSIAKPLIVLTSVIMSVSGVLYGLVVFQMPFGIIMTGIGIISLAGVVVNNAIVLIDYVDILRSRDGLGLYEALLQGGITRFRPVILTAVTTVLGLVPLATGFNIDFFTFFVNPVEFFTNMHLYVYSGGAQAAWWAPMAIAVIVGLSFSTMITLILVPVLYSLFDSMERRIKQYFYDRKEMKASYAANSNGSEKNRIPSSEVEIEDEVYAASPVSNINPSPAT
jgi:multidrug efflux pump